MTTTDMHLSSAMRVALRAVVRKPGRYAESYPGGLKSVRALERRELVRLETVTTAGVEGDAIYPTPYGLRVAWSLDR